MTTKEPPGPSAGDPAARAALAEREAQIAALREALTFAVTNAPQDARGRNICLVCGVSIGGEPHEDGCVLGLALTSTADAAGRCIARAKAEGAEGLRERLARISHAHGRRRQAAS